ncbi:MAG TPA: 6-phosphogluconolactonase, partial [Pilimelia sp.]|nr:6-phosphogluconolactonase [Pilimelia sp.]
MYQFAVGKIRCGMSQRGEGMLTTVFDGAEELADFAARRISEALSTLRALSGHCLLALTGGSTPGLTYRRLATMPIDWSHIDIIQTDERLGVPRDATSAAVIERELIGPAGVPAERWHRMPHESDPAVGARRYAALLRRLAPTGHPDVVVLGLGEDGHTASLFTDPVQTSDPVIITGPYGGALRMSLDTATIAAASVRIMLAAGSGKARAVRQLAGAAPVDPHP